MHALLSREYGLAWHQGCPATCLVPFISDLDTLDDVGRISFGNRASVVPRNRTRTSVAHAGDRDAVDCVMPGCDVNHFAAMTGEVAETNNAWHDQDSLVVPLSSAGASP